MLFEKSQEPKYIVGFDLRDDFSQISYMENPGNRPARDPVTFSIKQGAEQFDIPTAIAKTIGVNKWSCGPDAAASAADGSSVYVPNLLSLAIDGRPVPIENGQYEPTALLALFVNRALGLLSRDVKTAEIASITFTARNMDQKMIRILENVRKRLSLKCRIFYENYANSYYNYLLMQAESVREPASILCEMARGGRLLISTMNFNQHTQPIVAFKKDTSFPYLSGRTPQERDEEFLVDLQAAVGKKKYASAFLLGTGFQGGWMKKSLAWLCRDRRVFLGSNLYSKGAAYGGYFRLCTVPEARKYYFLDSSRLQANIGIRGLDRGEMKLCSILDAGTSWYEADVTKDVILENGNEIHLTLTPLTGGKASDYMIRLDGLPVREGRAARIRMHFTMSAPDKVEVSLEDLGFGEIFPSSGIRWGQTITIQ